MDPSCNLEAAQSSPGLPTGPCTSPRLAERASSHRSLVSAAGWLRQCAGDKGTNILGGRVCHSDVTAHSQILQGKLRNTNKNMGALNCLGPGCVPQKRCDMVEKPLLRPWKSRSPSRGAEFGASKGAQEKKG